MLLGSIIYENSGNVGLGITNPTNKFEVDGHMILTNDIYCDYTWTNKIIIPRYTSASFTWSIYKSTVDPSTAWGGTGFINDLVFLYGDANDGGGECWLRCDDTGNDDLDFTGFHKCILEDINLIPLLTSNLEYYKGM